MKKTERQCSLQLMNSKDKFQGKNSIAVASIASAVKILLRKINFFTNSKSYDFGLKLKMQDRTQTGCTTDP